MPPTPDEVRTRYWLITGGCGFVGAALVRRLTELGATQVRVVDALEGAWREALPAGPWRGLRLIDVRNTWPPGLQVVRAEAEDRAAMAQCARGADVIVHLERSGTAGVLEAARLARVRRVVLASVLDAADGLEEGRAPDAAPPPITEYISR